MHALLNCLNLQKTFPENFVLSAGHCAHGRTGPAAAVRLGEFDKHRTNDDARVEDLRIIEVIPHPAYKSSSQYNDIALFKLDRNAKLGPYVRPLCLPEKRAIKEKSEYSHKCNKCVIPNESVQLQRQSRPDGVVLDGQTTSLTNF